MASVTAEQSRMRKEQNERRACMMKNQQVRVGSEGVYRRYASAFDVSSESEEDVRCDVFVDPPLPKKSSLEA